jgi:hypothetical protein
VGAERNCNGSRTGWFPRWTSVEIVLGGKARRPLFTTPLFIFLVYTLLFKIECLLGLVFCDEMIARRRCLVF